MAVLGYVSVSANPQRALTEKTNQPPLIEGHTVQGDLRPIVVGEGLGGHIEPVHRVVPEGCTYDKFLNIGGNRRGKRSPMWADAVDASPARAR